LFKLSIPRGIVYHKIIRDFLSLFSACFSRLSSKKAIDKFEKAFASYLGSKHCVAFPYARVAIYYALKNKNLPTGSEIIMPPMTIKAILDVVLDLGLKPVFVDIERDSLCFDQEKLEKAVNSKTKAILVTYLYGMVPDLETMISFCREKKLFIMEDFSQCLNGEFQGRKVGTFGDIGIYSASSIKTLDTYGGGLLVSNNDQLSQKIREAANTLSKPSRVLLIHKVLVNLIRNLATTRLVFHFSVFPLLKLLSKIKPGSITKHTGDREKTMRDTLPQEWFSAYTSFQAKIGLKLLPNVSPSDDVRIRYAQLIRSEVGGVNFPGGAVGAKNVYWQTIAYFTNPENVLKFLMKNRIDSSKTSLEKISALSNYPCQGVTPEADKLYDNAIFIPSYPGLKPKDVGHIIKTLNSFDLNWQGKNE
jgi:perosamine synthetase